MPALPRRALLFAPALLAPQAAGAQAAPQIVILGDSLTAGLGLRADQAFPARLDARLKAQGIGVRIQNAGVSGDTTASGLARLDFSVPRTAQGVLVALGANDMLQGLPAAAAQRNLDTILARLKARGQRVALSGMRAPANWGAAYQRSFDAIFPALARKHGVALDPFLLEGVALDPRLNQADGIHPNAAGAERIAARLAPFVVRAFGLRRAA
jgi:acyl-CoA thioesterase-1